ncbi:MAG: D-alanyl-D-alanine carboxypeptidase/D-alanyl-D-alanine-endopeptidase [Bacteroidetes bacterium]|jgi:D-alanyl-D-alanine carboxypeptidase/D-alanyl-D-alanine-endopeptidase (penicillin-binding protein 4)|nr:D-alanyl-D-alanine carboxypeptidase/D-alanyl-D-alanine-endopeptidase [Bacteroidota bacterium]
MGKANRIIRFVLIKLIFFFVAGSIGTAFAQLSDPIRSLVEESEASGAFWVIQVRDSDGNLLENLNGDKIIRPASNLKLVSSGLFLEELGPDYRFETRLYGSGELRDSTWYGNLYVEGTGDPTISGIFYNENPLFLFERWSDSLRARGIHSISGNLIGYNAAFDDMPYPEGWEWSDLTFYYAPEISALSFNNNVVDIKVTADGPVGSVPNIEWHPFNTPYVEFINEQEIRPSDTEYEESYQRLLGSNRILLRSKLPRGYIESEPLSVHNAAAYFMDTFHRVLENEGVQVSGHVGVEIDSSRWVPSALTLLAEHQSEPLSRLIQQLNRESDNFYTEMLLKKTVTEAMGIRGRTEPGLELLKEYMHKMDFDTSAVNLKDASGMAPANYIKGGDLNQFLLKIKEKEYFTDFYESLSVGGENGTMEHRFRNSVVKGFFYGKTGFVSGVRAHSGYLETQSGRELAVTIVTNNYTAKTSDVDRIHQRILEFLHLTY